MTFDARETSIEGGQPLRLYEFRRGLIRWRYTDADRPITFLGETFQTLAISDDGIRYSGETSADVLKVTVPWSNPVARLYRGIPPSEDIELWVRDMHYGDTEAIIQWIGSIQTVQFPSPERAVIVCQNVTATLDRPGLRLGYERGCVHALYDHNCKVDREEFVVAATIEALNGLQVSSAVLDTFADGWFNAGYIEWDLTLGEVETRAIEIHVGSTIQLMGGTQGLSLEQLVRFYPGCARIAEVCNNKFNNLPRYGGIPHLPGRSPFDGNPLF